jgi:beta-1,4-mannosyl-glycoprotein beta-1,4-N-acetylglucosaminyltransferase
MTELRNPSHKAVSTRIDNGGQHFSYVGGPNATSAEERVRAKLAESAHQELNGWRTNSFLKGRLSKGKDIFGRRGTKFVSRDNLDYLPQFVLQNRLKFENLFLK